jgi:hypothetical protein
MFLGDIYIYGDLFLQVGGGPAAIVSDRPFLS